MSIVEPLNEFRNDGAMTEKPYSSTGKMKIRSTDAQKKVKKVPRIVQNMQSDRNGTFFPRSSASTDTFAKFNWFLVKSNETYDYTVARKPLAPSKAIL